MRLDWEAAYLDGRSAARRRATVRIGRTGLEITLADGPGPMRWPYREIRQTQGAYAGEQVRLEVVPGDMARPDIAPPESLQDVMVALKKTYPANTLVVTLYTPDEGVTLGGKVIPNLPDSALDTARPATSTRRGEAYKSISRTVVPSKRVVMGRAELTIKVQDKK